METGEKHIVEIYVDAQVRAIQSDEEIKSKLAFAIELSCANVAPLVYNRHRWTGMDLSLDALGRLAIIHGLLPTV